MRRSLAFLVLAISWTALSAVPAQAQSNQGRMSGIVNDENSRPIKAATVEAESRDTNQSFTATTDEKGRFTFIGLRPGTWQFTAGAPGFFGERGNAPIRIGAPNPPMVFVLKKSGALNGGVLGNMSPKDLHGQLAAADLLFTQKKYDQAIAAYRAILQKEPSLYTIDLQIGSAFFNKSDYDAALAAYGDVLKSNPGNADAIVAIANVYSTRGDRQGAIDWLTKAANAPATSSRDVFSDLADVMLESGNVDGACTWYKKAADADPSSGKGWYGLGACAEKKGDADAARQYFAKVIAVDPVSPEAVTAKATLDQLSR